MKNDVIAKSLHNCCEIRFSWTACSLYRSTWNLSNKTLTGDDLDRWSTAGLMIYLVFCGRLLFACNYMRISTKFITGGACLFLELRIRSRGSCSRLDPSAWSADVQKCCSLGSQDDIQVPQEPSEPWAAGHDSARILKLTTTRILKRLDIPWKSWTLYQVLFDLKSSNICASICLQHVVFGKQGLDHRWSKFPSVAQSVCSSGGGGNLCAAVINLWKLFELQLRQLINVPQLLQYTRHQISPLFLLHTWTARIGEQHDPQVDRKRLH